VRPTEAREAAERRAWIHSLRDGRSAAIDNANLIVADQF
jgi:hypothetical protein